MDDATFARFPQALMILFNAEGYFSVGSIISLLSGESSFNSKKEV